MLEVKKGKILATEMEADLWFVQILVIKIGRRLEAYIFFSFCMMFFFYVIILFLDIL